MKVVLIFTNPSDCVFVSAVWLSVNTGRAPLQVLLVSVVLSQPPRQLTALERPWPTSSGAMRQHPPAAPCGLLTSCTSLLAARHGASSLC